MRLAAGTPDPARQHVQPVTAGIGIILTRLPVAGHHVDDNNARRGGGHPSKLCLAYTRRTRIAGAAK